MWLLRRLAWSLITLWGITLLTFSLIFLGPSDPALTIAGPKADQQTLATIRAELGLDRPVLAQYAHYMGRLLHGDFGRSYITRRPVQEALFERLPATAYLAATTLLFALLGGVCVGSFSKGCRRT